LTATVALGLLTAYSLVFLIPGVAVSVLLAAARQEPADSPLAARAHTAAGRGGAFCVVSAGVLLWVYVVFAQPNTAPSLREFWFDERASNWDLLAQGAFGLIRQLPIPGDLLRYRSAVGLSVTLIVVAGLWLTIRQCRDRRPSALWVPVLCGIPILVALTANALKIYPVSIRTSLFLMPGTALLVVQSVRALTDEATRVLDRPGLDRAVAVALVAMPLLLAGYLVSRPADRLRAPTEDFASAIAHLQSRARPADTIWVHASSVEAFKFYARLRAWTPPAVVYGATGWPCCPRGVRIVRGARDAAWARADLEREVPPGFSGRLWLLHTALAEHWRFVGVDEAGILQEILSARGCQIDATPTFTNVGLSAFDCSPVE
jgi:hypothetical protein